MFPNVNWKIFCISIDLKNKVRSLNRYLEDDLADSPGLFIRKSRPMDIFRKENSIHAFF